MEENLANGLKKTRIVYDISLLNLNELSPFLKDKKYRETLATNLDSYKADKYYAVKINNNGMMPLFDKGKVFVIVCNTYIHDGDIVLVQFGDHPTCFRKIFIEEENYFFKPISELISGEIVRSSNFTIHGIVIKAIQNLHE